LYSLQPYLLLLLLLVVVVRPRLSHQQPPDM
jgi:hypothetical protein